MKKIITFLATILIIFTLSSCDGAPAAPTSNEPAETKPKVAATIFPLADIAKNIAGDKFEIIGILPPGSSPHTFDLSPGDIKKLTDVSQIFAIGHDLDSWTDKIAESIDVPVYTVDKGVTLQPSDPHYWMSVDNAMIIAQNITEEIIRLDPDNQEYYDNNLQQYVQKLTDLEQLGKTTFETVQNKKIIVFHDSWSYFADDFGLEIAGVFEKAPGKQPTPQYLADLYRTAQDNEIKAVFAEPQLSSDVVIPFIEDLGLELFVIDPLGGVDGRGSYIENMTYNIKTIDEALR